MSSRKAIPMKPRLRFEVFKRDLFSCQYCGRKPPVVILEVDHIHPQSKGGTDDSTNLITSCADCNRGKGAGMLSDRIQPLSESLERERERSAQVKRYNRWLRSIRKQKEKDLNTISDAVINGMGRDPSQWKMSIMWEQAVKTFMDRLPSQLILEAVELTVNRFGGLSGHSAHKYFCGVCWHKIKGTTEEDRRGTTG